MLLPLTLTTPKLFEDVLWIQHILHNIIFYTTENLPVIFWKSVWETLSQDTPERSSCSFIPGEHGFQTQPHFGGFPGVCGIQNLISFPTKDKGKNDLNFLLKNPNSKLFGVNQLRKGTKGGFLERIQRLLVPALFQQVNRLKLTRAQIKLHTTGLYS